jgi:hypothetical protein
MMQRLRDWLRRGPAEPGPAPDAETEAALAAALERDPYLYLADAELRLISVFDDLRYDRADMDMLTGPMRARAARTLAPLGLRQVSGGMMANPARGLRLHLPKFRALGASPFDALRDTARARGDYALLTPTQAACAILDGHATDAAVPRLERLVTRHPVNLLRIFDYLDRSARHDGYRRAIGHLVPLQRAAVREAPLRDRRALR